jgi:hypothetical protein
MHSVEAGAGGNCLFHSLLAGEHTPKPHPSDYKPPTPFEKYYLTRRPFVSFSLSALRDLQKRIGHDMDLPLDHVQMRRRIVEFEQAHLDHEIFREVQSFSGSQQHGSGSRSRNRRVNGESGGAEQGHCSAREYIRTNGIMWPDGSICYMPEWYLRV